MTDKHKLQCLFEAALKDPSLPSGGVPRRAFPVPVFDAMPVPRVEATPLRAVYPTRSIPSVPVAALPSDSPWQGSQPTMARILDRAASSELAGLMQNQNRWEHRKFRLNLLSTATVVSTLAAVGFVWWLQTRQELPTPAETTSEFRPADGSGPTTGESSAVNNAPPSSEAAALESGLSSTSQR
jgi:hypothetical protein